MGVSTRATAAINQTLEDVEFETVEFTNEHGPHHRVAFEDVAYLGVIRQVSAADAVDGKRWPTFQVDGPIGVLRDDDDPFLEDLSRNHA